MSRMIRIIVSVLMCALPLHSSGQTKNNHPVIKILRPALLKIRPRANAPIFLPSRLPSTINARAIRVVDGEGKPDGWEITLFYKQSCGQACLVAWFSATRSQKVTREETRKDADKTVRLVNGINGYYSARSCGGSCTPPQINWFYGGVLYTIQFNVNGKTKRQDEAEVIGMANSAILGGPR